MVSCVCGVSIFNIMFEFQYLFSLFSLFLSFLCHINLIIFLPLTLKIWIYMCMLKKSLKWSFSTILFIVQFSLRKWGLLNNVTCKCVLLVLYYQSFHCIQTMIIGYIDITINCIYFDIMEIYIYIYIYTHTLTNIAGRPYTKLRTPTKPFCC